MAKVSWWQTSIGDAAVEAAVSALKDGKLSQGPIGAAFESEVADRLDVPFMMTVPSGSAALTACMIALGVGNGDEVIVPDNTWIATAHAAALLGAKVVFADAGAERPLIDPDEVKRRITDRTKAIIAVHLGGRAADMAALQAVAEPSGIPIIEDACQAFMSRGPDGYLGTHGTAGCFSLGVAKLLTTGQGGFVVTRDGALHKRLLEIKFHGVAVSDDGWERYTGLGFNLKFTDFQAAMGLAQLDRIDDAVARVHAVYRRYEEGLANLPYLCVSSVRLADGEVPLWTEIETPYLSDVQAYLTENDIETRRVHPPLHLAPHMRQKGTFDNSRRFADEILVLPSGPAQPLENVERTTELLRAYRPEGRGCTS